MMWNEILKLCRDEPFVAVLIMISVPIAVGCIAVVFCTYPITFGSLIALIVILYLFVRMLGRMAKDE